jgi:DNA-binding MarR family transcriptional regulator
MRALHAALLDIVAVINQPQRDAFLIEQAGIPLDRPLFAALVGIRRCGPVGVVDLADRLGRDYTTVSRQVARLEDLGLVKRQANSADRRIREAVLTAKGKAMTDAIDAAREKIGRAIFKTWEAQDVDDLVRLVQKFASALTDDPATGADGRPHAGKTT